jgi:hypothetical protein
VNAGTKPRALRIANYPKDRPSRLGELARLVGQPATIELELTVRTPSGIAHLAQEMGAVAVLVDSYRGDLEALRLALAPVPLLRPMFDLRLDLHAGQPEERFCGYGRLTEYGTVEPLADGALAP